jgi:transposase
MPENGKEYPMEVVERAEDAYCVEGLTFDQVATLTGVSASTLKRWSDRYVWQEKRENIRRARSAIRTNRVMLHAKLIENCLKTLKPMDAFAVSSIEGVVQRAAQSAARGQTREALAMDPERMREIKTDADAISALEEAVEIKINRMLANPEGLSYGGMKEIGQALELLKEMKGRFAAEDKGEGPKALSAVRIRELREKLL